MSSEVKSGIHPLVATAAVAVIVLAGVAVAAFTGVLPGTSGKPADTLAATPAAEPAKAATPKTADVRPAQPKAAASRPAQAARPAPAPVAVIKCTVCGVVEAVQEVEVKGEATGAGAVAGGLAGAVVGNQVGSGSKKKVARVIGAVGGAVVGHQIEKHARTTKRYDITVRMEDGTLRTLSQEQAPTWRVGDKVRVVNDALEAG